MIKIFGGGLMVKCLETLMERLKGLGWVYADYYPDETVIHKQRRKSVAYDDVIAIVNQLSEECGKQWTKVTDDEDSYPKPFEYVLVKDDFGDLNVACCYPDYEWYISNGESSIKLTGDVVEWRELSESCAMK